MKKLCSLALALALILSLSALPALAGMYVRDPLAPDTFSADEDDDGTLTFNFKSPKPESGAWANIMNPWGDSAYMTVIPGEGIQSFFLTFEITGYDGGDDGYRAMAGFGINGWTPSIWSIDNSGSDNDNWESVFGEEYFFYIDGDGFYRMIISFRAAMDYAESKEPLHRKDWLESVDCIELGIFGPGEDTTMRVRIVDLEESENVYSLESIQRLKGSPLYASAEELPALPDPVPWSPPVDEDDGTDPPVDENPSPEPPAAPDPTPASDPTPSAAEQSPPAESNGDGGLGVWLWVIIGGGVVVAGVIVFMVTKKK